MAAILAALALARCCRVVVVVVTDPDTDAAVSEGVTHE